MKNEKLKCLESINLTFLPFDQIFNLSSLYSQNKRFVENLRTKAQMIIKISGQLDEIDDFM